MTLVELTLLAALVGGVGFFLVMCAGIVSMTVTGYLLWRDNRRKDNGES